MINENNIHPTLEVLVCKVSSFSFISDNFDLNLLNFYVCRNANIFMIQEVWSVASPRCRSPADGVWKTETCPTAAFVKQNFAKYELTGSSTFQINIML